MLRTREGGVHTADGALSEATFAVGQVEVPHALEAFAVAEAGDQFGVGLEAIAPVGQGAGVVRGDIHQTGEAQVAGSGGGVTEGADGGDAGAGEDELLS